MVSIQIRDNADEFRVEVAGKFAGSVVDDVLYLWKAVLLELDSRRFTIDISSLTGYDYAGCSLLSDMQRHGTHIVASSPLSLVFLNEISSPARKLGLALVRSNGRSADAETKPPRKEKAALQLVPIAAGE